MLNRCRALTAASPGRRPPDLSGNLRKSRYNRRLPWVVSIAQPYMLTIADGIRSICNPERQWEVRGWQDALR
jgi:hypothetical protein